MISVDLGSEGPVGVGSTARVVREADGQRVEAPLTVTAYEPPARLAIDSEVSGVRAGAELQLAADGPATILRFAMEIRASGMARFMEPMIAGAAGGEIDESIRRVQQRFAGTDEGLRHRWWRVHRPARGRRLLDHGADVRAIARSGTSADWLRDAGCEVVIGDVLDASLLRQALDGVDVAYHLAGDYRVGIREAERPAMEAINVTATERVLDSAVAPG